MRDDTARELDAEEQHVRLTRDTEWFGDPAQVPEIRARWMKAVLSMPEPEELAAQAEAIAAKREHNATRCATCNRPRTAHTPNPNRGYAAPSCTFQEPQ